MPTPQWSHLLAEGCAIACLAAGLCVIYMLLAERCDRRRARYLDRMEREQTGEAEPQREEGK